MTDFTKGITYKKGVIDADLEMIPQNPAFRSFGGEAHYFEKWDARVSYESVANAVAEGVITDLDKTVLSLIATFSGGVSSKALKEMLIMMDVPYTETVFDSSVKRLHRFNLINFSRFAVEGKPAAKMRAITLAQYGSLLARSFGVEHRFSFKDLTNVQAYQMKSRIQAVHLICNYLKRGLADSFEVRPVIMVDPREGEIVRPAASITVRGEKIYFEVPRHRDGWLEDIADKLRRYELVFKGEEIPTVIICGEDEEMNREISAMVAEKGYDLEIFYTNDLEMFGERFRYSIYGFDGDEKLGYEFIALDRAEK